MFEIRILDFDTTGLIKSFSFLRKWFVLALLIEEKWVRIMKFSNFSHTKRSYTQLRMGNFSAILDQLHLMSKNFENFIILIFLQLTILIFPLISLWKNQLF
jgi:hypothetical protein